MQRNVSRVWVKNHVDGGWITATWTHLRAAPAPFGELAWQHARALLAQRGTDPATEAEIAQAASALLDRAAHGPSQCWALALASTVPYPPASPPRRPGPLPLPVPLVAGEFLASYLDRLAAAHHVTIADLLSVLPPWFVTKFHNHDGRSQHHMLAPATDEALHTLAALTGKAPAVLARALPAFGAGYLPDPVRATTACRRCLAVRGIHEPVPIHLPALRQVCTQHGRWLSVADLPQFDLADCSGIILVQQRVRRLLRRHTPERALLTYLIAAGTIRDLPYRFSQAPPGTPSSRPLRRRLSALTASRNGHIGREA